MSSIQDELKEGIAVFFPIYLEAYREHVHSLYPLEHKECGSFSFMNPIYLFVLLRSHNTHLIFTNGDSIDRVSFIDPADIEVDEFEKLSSSSRKTKKAYIDSIIGEKDCIEDIKISAIVEHGTFAFKSVNREYLLEASKKWGIEKADEHYQTYLFTKALENALNPNTELTVVDTDDILQRVQNHAFQYEFGESAKAYNAGLYLAAASTAGIALENILRLIIVRRMKDNTLPRNSFIRDSVLKLDKENILPGRLRSRVWEKSGIRNSHSHTNEDPVRKETVESLFLIIEDLVPYTL